MSWQQTLGNTATGSTTLIAFGEKIDDVTAWINDWCASDANSIWNISASSIT
jgi:hypothetical protein